MTTAQLQVYGLNQIPEVEKGDDLATVILNACNHQGLTIAHRDIFVITQKIVSKIEGRILPLSDLKPSPLALQFAHDSQKDARVVELVLQQASKIVKMERGVLVTETEHGYVCANSGVDVSNIRENDSASILPKDADRTARRVRKMIWEKTHRDVAVLISDTFGRPWRQGAVNVTIGLDGMFGLTDYRGQKDDNGQTLTSTIISVADELASAAELVMGKVNRIPIALIRGYEYNPVDSDSKDLIRESKNDLFR